jgi:transposase-like protein
MTRRVWTIEQKAAIVLEGLKGESKIVDLCRKYQISEALYYKWRDIFLEGGKNALSNGRTNRDKELESKISGYEQIIGQKTVELEALKKTLVWDK